MNIEDLEYLYEHSQQYGGTAYAEWFVSEYCDDSEIPDVDHRNEYRRFESEQQ